MYYKLKIQKLILFLFITATIIIHLAIINIALSKIGDKFVRFDENIESELLSVKNKFNLYKSIVRGINREDMWMTGMKMIIENPVFGLGLGLYNPDVIHYLYLNYDGMNLDVAETEDKGFISKSSHFHAHNILLQSMLTMGIGMLPITILLYAIPFFYAKKILNSTDDNVKRTLVITSVTCLCYDIFTGLFEPAGVISFGSISFLFIFSSSIIFLVPKMNFENKN